MKKEIINIMLADDHDLFSEGVKSIIEADASLKVVAKASNGAEVLIKLKSYLVDLIIMDIQMPVLDGIEATRQVKSKYPEIKILALTMHTERVYIEEMYKAGVNGYLEKNTSKTELITAIKKVHKGEKYFSNDIVSNLLNFSTNSTTNSRPQNFNLTRREKEILSLIASEQSNQEIAEKLFLSVETVNTHRKNLLRKLNVKNTAGLVKHAYNLNLHRKGTQEN